MKTRLFKLILLLVTTTLFCQVQFEHYTIENGLSNNSIRRIIQDKKGFLWFGTINGLNRFDGKSIRTFTFEPGNLNSLSSNRIYNLYEDSLGYIWIFTFENQVLRYDPKKEQFTNLNYQYPEVFHMGQGRIHFFESSKGIIWLLPENRGVVRIIEKTNHENMIVDRISQLNGLISDNVNFIQKDFENRIWIGSEKGLGYLSYDTIQPINDKYSLVWKNKNINFTSFLNSKQFGLLFGTNSYGIYQFQNNELHRWNATIDTPFTVNEIKEGKYNDILITTANKGFFYINSEKKVWNYAPGNTTDKFIFNEYFEIYNDNLGIFWIISHNRGVSMYDPLEKKPVYFDLNKDFRESPGDVDKQTFLEDINGDLWIGLYGGGLCKLNRKEQKFQHFYHSKNNPNSLSSNFVLSLFEDRSCNLWIGTFQGGLNKVELIQNNFQYIEPVKNAVFNSQNEVRSLAEDEYQRLWTGTKEGHIYCYTPYNKMIFRIPEDLKNKTDYKKSNVYALLVDNEDLWIGTKGEGLYKIKGLLSEKLEKNKNYTIENYRYEPENPKSLPHNDIFAITRDYLGQIWVGTYHGGIAFIENPDEETTFNRLIHNPKDTTSISDNRIRCIYEDKEDNLWIGTSHGLNYLDNKYLNTNNKKFKRYLNHPTKYHSISNNDIFNVLQDHNGNILAATYGGGLNILNPKKNIANHFFRKDGLPSDVVFSILEDNNHNLWLGTDNGLCKFTNLGKQIERYLDKEGPGENFFSEGTCIEMQNGDFIFGQKSGFLRFNPDSIKRDIKNYPLVLTSLNIFDKPVYPSQEDSPLNTSIESTKEVTLKHNQNFIGLEFAVLDYKSPEKIQYAFILENFEKKWNYVTNQNKAIYRGLAPGEYIFKVKATNSNGIWTDTPKELIINILPPIWKTKWAMLIYAALTICLVWLITYLISKEIRIKNEINYEKRLTEEKLTFFTNISHEFKTPLTLINNSVDDLTELKVVSDEMQSRIGSIKKNTNRLNNLIEQLLDFRRIQKGKMELKTNKINIVTYLNDLYLTFLPYAEKKNIEFLFNTNKKQYQGWLDTRHIEKIVINILSNAFKHTPEKKRILFDIKINSEKDLLNINIIDQGEGIKQEYLEKIFERFVFIDKDIFNQFKGSGIGLSLSRDLALLHKGNIKVQSELKKGSKFTIEIPVGETNYLDNEKEIQPNNESHHQVIPFHIEMDDNFEPDTPINIKTSSAIKSQVLVIEDNDELRNYLFEKLKKNFLVNTAQNGEEGFALANETEPDIIITDVKMPLMDGIELTKKLKNNFNTSHIPIVQLTAKSSIESKIEGLDSGADDYITKPFNMNYLQKRILNIVSQRKKLKEKFSQDPGFKPEKLTVSGNDQKFLTKVINQIEVNMKEHNWSIDNLIEVLGYSRTVFYKKMKGISGYAPKEFIRIVKMKKAAAMLRDPDTTITQVSYDVGYSDPDYFSKSFKNYFGEPPSEYQKKYK